MFYNLVKKYRNFDIAIYYEGGSPKQISRLKKYVPCIKWNGERVKCHRFFSNYDTQMIEFVDADEYIQILHADYKQQGITPHTHPKFTKYVGVSKTVCDSFTELTGLKSEVCYNPILIEEEETKIKSLSLLAMTRLTKEKGKSRYQALVNKLDARHVPYTLYIYSNDHTGISSPNVVWREPTLEVYPIMNSCDVYLNLSDSEGWCYSVNEFLSLKQPNQLLVITPCPSFIEMDTHGVFLDFDLSNIDEVVDKIEKLTHIKRDKPTFTPKLDRWGELLYKSESTYKGDLPVKIKALLDYYDTYEQKNIKEGEIYDTVSERADFIIANNYAIKVEEDVKIVEKVAEIVEKKPRKRAK